MGPFRVMRQNILIIEDDEDIADDEEDDEDADEDADGDKDA